VNSQPPYTANGGRRDLIEGVSAPVKARQIKFKISGVKMPLTSPPAKIGLPKIGKMTSITTS